jgi:hypothetical protein
MRASGRLFCLSSVCFDGYAGDILTDIISRYQQCTHPRYFIANTRISVKYPRKIQDISQSYVNLAKSADISEVETYPYSYCSNEHMLLMISGFRRDVDQIYTLFWDITQRRVVILYRRFGTTYRSNFLTLEDGTDMLSRNIGKVFPLYAT